MIEEQELIREAMRAIGRRTSDRKAAASRANGAKSQVTEEMREKMREAQRLRRDREQAERAALGLDAPQEKKPVGRPRKVTVEAAPTDANAPKRGRGRPKKQEGTVAE